MIIGHQLVKADWRRFSPTKPVKAKNQGWSTVSARTTESRTKNPAIARSYSLTFMSVVSFGRRSFDRERVARVQAASTWAGAAFSMPTAFRYM